MPVCALEGQAFPGFETSALANANEFRNSNRDGLEIRIEILNRLHLVVICYVKTCAACPAYAVAGAFLQGPDFDYAYIQSVASAQTSHLQLRMGDPILTDTRVVGHLKLTQQRL